MLEITGILRGSSEVWDHKFNLIGVSLTKPLLVVIEARVEVDAVGPEIHIALGR